MNPECHHDSRVQGHPLAWISPQKSCSEEFSLLVAGRALGAIPLLSSVPSPSSCLKTWTALLYPGENRRRRPQSFPDKEAQGFPRCFLYFEDVPRWTLKRDTDSLASDGQFAILHGPRIQAALSPCRLS